MWRHRLLHRSRDLAEIAADDPCPACRVAGQDWAAIAPALRALVAPGRPRDFRLTADDVRRLAPAPARTAPRMSLSPRLGGALVAGLLLVMVAGVRHAASPAPGGIEATGPAVLVAPVAGDAARSATDAHASTTVMTLAAPSGPTVVPSASPSVAPDRP